MFVNALSSAHKQSSGTAEVLLWYRLSHSLPSGQGFMERAHFTCCEGEQRGAVYNPAHRALWMHRQGCAIAASLPSPAL